MKKILFIPTYTYLSSPIFTNLLPKLKEFETIYLDVEDQYQSKKTSKQFKSQFSKVIELHMNAKNRTFFDKILKFVKMLKYKSRFKKLIEEEHPSVVVTTGDLTFSVRILKMYFPDIPLIVIQSALFADKGIPRKTFQNISYLLFNKIMRIPIASRQNYFGQEIDDAYLLLWGDYFRKMVPNNKKYIYVVGDITFDGFPIKKESLVKKDFLLGANMPLDTKVVVICTSVLESLTSKETVDSLHKIYTDLVKKRKDLFFLIKPHPRNDTEELRNIFESLAANNCVVLDTDLHELFKYADIHISSFSRTAIEAVASNIPVVSVNPNNEILLQDFLDNELNERVTNSEEMYDKIEDILQNKDSYLLLGKRYIENRLYKLDGKAAKRAIYIIKKEIE